MEKVYSSDKPGSFRSRHYSKKSDGSSPRTPKLSSIDELSDIHDVSWREMVEDIDDHVVNVHQVSERIDQFTLSLSSFEKDSDSMQVPEDVEMFSKILESRIVKYCSPNYVSRFGVIEEEDLFFIEAVNRMSRLTKALGNLPLASSNTTSLLNRTSMVLQRAMLFLEEEFQDVLEDSRKADPNLDHSADFCILPEKSTSTEGEYMVYSSEVVARMKRIASVMFSAGYENECCQVYSVARRTAFNEELRNIGFETISIDDVQRMDWEQLEEKIATWIKVVKYCTAVLFSGERKLSSDVFSENLPASSILFNNLARMVTIQLLNFADAVGLTKRSSEKLFKYLDMYEALNDLIPSVHNSCSEDCTSELLSEISDAGERIGSGAVHIFCDLESSIKCEAVRTPVPGGAVHPLTRYVMNYLKYACEYKDTLEQIFRKNKILIRSISLAKSDSQDERPGNGKPSSSPFAVQVMTVVELLNDNLDSKSKLYRDISLRYIFLMNNGRYILQKIKGSAEILQLVGDTWYRTRSTVVRQYHKNYQRETWGRLLQCLGHDGLQVSGKVNKPILKERFKNFSAMFDEIHKAQSTWVVSDEQLQSELRVSISALVIPAYRSFLGRFKHYLESSKQSEKYIKYQPEDVETMIEGLFDGNPNSMGRRR